MMKKVLIINEDDEEAKQLQELFNTLKTSNIPRLCLELEQI